MADTREAILARLAVVAAGIPGVAASFRNKDETSKRPAIVILDADETAQPGDEPLFHPGYSPNLVAMIPETYILLSAAPADVGSQLNAIRVNLVAAVLQDTDLAALVGPNGRIRYDGCYTELGRGRAMEGLMGLSFTFTYVVDPLDL